MRIFVISLVVGAALAIAVELQAEDETLPMPIHTKDSTSSLRYPNTSKEDMIKASRVERAKYVAARNLAIESWNRWNGINTGRPQVNSGYMYLAPPRYVYRWVGPMYPTNIYANGNPIQ